MKINHSMNTTFFKQIEQLNIEGNLQVSVQKSEDDTLIVSVLLQNDACGDNAKNLIPPLVLQDRAEELDEQFFTLIAKPIEETSSLMVNMENYLQAQEQAKKQSAMEKDKAERERKDKAEKKKKYDKAVEKSEQLEAEGKYREAWTALPDGKDFAEFADELKERKCKLEKQFAPSLFSNNQ